MISKTFRTFAAVNAKTRRMQRHTPTESRKSYRPTPANNRRRIASILLLAVFLSMLLFSSLHIHPDQTLTQDECTDCVAHHCGGHIGQQTLSFDDCVLCQFLTLPMAIASVAAVVFINIICKQRPNTHRPLVWNTFWGHIVTRGPPFA